MLSLQLNNRLSMTVKIAFLINADADLQQLYRLIEALPEESEFFIHVDLKVDLDEFTDKIRDERVHFIDERYDVSIENISQVRYQMALIRAVLNDDTHFDYLFMINSCDYPVWTNKHILAYLNENHGHEFISGMCVANQKEVARLYTEYRFLNSMPWKYGSPLSKLRVALRHIVRAMGVSKPLSFTSQGQRFKLFKGSSRWCITIELATYALKQWDEDREYVKYFTTSYAPEQTFLHTLTFNSQKFATRGILFEGTFTSIEDLAPLTFIEYKPTLKVMTASDYDDIMASGKMFCSKTVSEKSDNLLDMLDKERQQ
jgi:hypothetical protein